jgi:hypothetical protein
MEVKDDNVGADNPSRRCVSNKRMEVVTDKPKMLGDLKVPNSSIYIISR